MIDALMVGILIFAALVWGFEWLDTHRSEQKCKPLFPEAHARNMREAEEAARKNKRWRW